MEADLSRHYGLDLRDLYRRDADGHRRLTLRMVHVRVEMLLKYEPASFTARELGGAGWQVGDYLAADLWSVQVGKPHPAYPKSQPSPQAEAKLRAARKRAADRQAQIDAGIIT